MMMNDENLPETGERRLAVPEGRVPGRRPWSEREALASRVEALSLPRGEEESRETIQEYLAIIRRRRWLILQTVAAVISAAMVMTLLMKPVYEATSKLIFEGQRGVFMLSGQGGIGAEGPRLGTQVELIQGRETAKRTARLLEEEGLRVSPSEVQQSTRARAIEDTDLVRVDVLHHDPRTAASMANAAAQAFIEWSEQRTKQGSRDTAEYIGRQLEVARADLLEAENRLRAFKESRGVVALSEETAARMNRISALEQDSARTAVDAREAQRRIAVLRGHLARQNENLASGQAIRDNELIQSLQARLVDLEAQLAQARERYTDRYPTKVIAELEAQVALTRQQLSRQVGAVVSGSAGALSLQEATLADLSRYESNLLALQARRQALEIYLHRERSKLADLPSQELELARLTRAADTAAKIYTSLLERSQEAKINQVMQVGNVHLGEPAIVPTAPIKPKPALNLTFAAVLGLLLGLGLAFSLEYLDNTVKTPSEATRYLGAPVLGIIPKLSDESRHPIALEKPRSPVTEAYRTLRSNVSFTGLGVAVPAVLITSAGVGEGKSVTAANLAVTMAQTGKRVILVDSDLRRPVLNKIFQLDGGPGLTDVIMGTASLDQALRSTAVEGLQVLPCGQRPPNPAELIDSDAMAQIVADLKQRAEIILFDSPPVVPVTDALLLAAYCDEVLVVCEAGAASRPGVLRARQLLEQARAPIAGIVLNKIEPGKHGYYYEYYYYYGDGQEPRHRKRRALPRRSKSAETAAHAEDDSSAVQAPPSSG